MNENQRILLPIGTRVTHFHGGGHGKGTILAYNGISANNYIKTNFEEAVEMAANAGLMDALVNSMYDGVRCPYVVQFDPRQPHEDENKFDIELRTKYPRGYKDVYEFDSVFPLEPNENIFPNDEVQYMARHWHEGLQQWGGWEVISAETYAAIGPGLSSTSEWQCCARELQVVSLAKG
jgi:hypothetical protein